MSFICLVLLASVHAQIPASYSWQWANDPFMEGMTDDGCDFPIYDLSEPNVNVDLSLKFPYVVRNMDLKWPAFEKWRKEAFLTNYGSNFVRSGSEASIVHSGGVAENETTLFEMINSMSNPKDQVYGDSFLFDTTILRSIPELTDDFTVPSIFQSWDKPSQESSGALWHMLSLGPSRSGLPFHNHGKTWLAVVHGIKQWYLYPPGYDPPQSVDMSFNPMYPVSRWLQEVYPSLEAFPKPPRSFFPTWHRTMIETTANTNLSITPLLEEGYRPFECRQLAGDVLFVPSRWTHLTLNLGETIAIGGQETLFNDDRLNSATEVLKTRPNNYDAWKDLGLAQFNLAVDETSKLRASLPIYGTSGPMMMSGHPSQLDALLERTRDTWVVLYYDSAVDSNLTDTLAIWTRLTTSLWGVTNVALFDLKDQYYLRWQNEYQREVDLQKVRADRRRIVSSLLPSIDHTVFAVSDDHVFVTLPMVKVHYGDVDSPELYDEFGPDVEGLTWTGEATDLAAIEKLVREEMRVVGLSKGSMSTVPVALLRRFNESLHNMKRALEIKPLQPELLCMIGEVAGLAHDPATTHAALLGAARILDGVDRTNMAAISLASMYHKIAHVYIKLQKWRDALPIMHKSVQVLPSFLPALADIVYIHNMLGDRNAAEYALEVLKVSVQDTPKVRNDVRVLSEQILEIPWK